MADRLLNSAKESQFKLPIVFLCMLAFVFHLAGSFLGGLLESWLCTFHSLFRKNREAVALACCILVWVLVALWIKYIELRPVRGLGFFKERFFKDSLSGLVLGFGLFALIVAVSCFLKIITVQSINLQQKNIFAVIMIIPFWFIQTGCEEILVRGWVLPAVYEKTNKAVAIVVSSLLFVALHCDNAGINALALTNIWLVSLFLSTYTLITDSLWAAVFFHTFWNFSQGSFFGLTVSGNRAMEPRLMTMICEGSPLLSGARFGTEASLITTVVLLMLLSGLIVFMKIKKIAILR